MRTLLPLAATLATSLVTSGTAGAYCEAYGLAPVVLTPAGTALPADGGVVVGAEVQNMAPLVEGDVALAPWRYRGPAPSAAPIAIAPGLAVFPVPAGATGALTLEHAEHAAHEVEATARATDKQVERLAAPAVRALRLRQRFGKDAGTTLTATLQGAVPATAVAIVVADGKGVGRAWGPVTAGAATAVPYSQAGCGVVSNGTQPPAAGDHVTLFWVDAAGRRSAVSKSIAVVAD